MRTGVIDREHLAVIGMKDRNRRIGFDPPRLTARQGREWADFKHDVDLPVMDFVAYYETRIAMCNSLW